MGSARALSAATSRPSAYQTTQSGSKSPSPAPLPDNYNVPYFDDASSFGIPSDPGEGEPINQIAHANHFDVPDHGTSSDHEVSCPSGILTVTYTLV